MEYPKMIPKYTPIDRPFNPNRKRYYLVQTDVHRRASDMEVLNMNEALPLGFHDIPIEKEIKVIVGKYADGYDSYYGGRYGIPTLHTKPRIKVGLRNKPLDVHMLSGAMFISSRAKALLERIDPGGFEFAECDTITRRNVELDPYWLMAVKRVVMEFDEVRSVYTERGGRNPAPLSPGTGVGIDKLFNIHMLPDMDPAAHAFYLLKYRTHFVFDQAIVDEWRTLRFNSLFFSPLQPATKKELKHAMSFTNYEYYFDFHKDD